MLASASASPPAAGPAAEAPYIYVCTVGSCHRAASEAVLLDLEELCKLAARNCASQLQPRVVPSGCLGYCSQAPNALLVLPRDDGSAAGDGEEFIFTRLSTRRATAELVLVATGAVQRPDDDCVTAERANDEAAERLLQEAASGDEAPRAARARQLRAITAAAAEKRWNSAARLALEVCGGDAAACPHSEDVSRYCSLLYAAGAWAAAHLVFAAQLSRAPPAPNRLRVWAAAGAARCLVHLGAGSDATALLLAEQAALRAVACQPTAETEPLLHMLSSTRSRLSALLRAQDARRGAGAAQLAPPPVPDGYERWQVVAVEPVSAWSFTLTARAPPLPRYAGSSAARRQVATSLWHVMALAEKAARPGEGPLPLLERQYTPVSSMEDWAQGHVTLLVRLYPAGAVSPWLARLAAEPPAARAGARTLLLGSPLPTVTSDDPAASAAAAPPGPVLLAVGGTASTVALQLLSCARHAWSAQPCCVIYSCRADDVLLLPQLEAAAAARGVPTRIRVHCTPAAPGQEQPFPAAAPHSGSGQQELPHCMVHAGRVTAQVVAEELAALQPRKSAAETRRRQRRAAADVWALVCGPQGFVQTIQAALLDAGLPRARITVLAG